MRFPPIPSQLEPSLAILGIDVDEQQLTAEVRARPWGIVAWIARKLGLGMVRVLMVTPQGLRFERTGFWGDFRDFYPAAQVTAVSYEHRRPVTFLVLAMLLLAGAIEAYFRRSELVTALVMLVLALLSVLLFAMSRKRVVLAVVDSSGSSDCLRFRPDRFQLHALQQLMRLMEAVLDVSPHALPEACDEVPLVARDRLIQVAAAEAVRPGPAEPTFDIPALSGASVSEVSAANTTRSEAAAADSTKTVDAGATGSSAPATNQSSVYVCPRCQARMRVPPDLAGRVVRCPSCGGETRLG